MANTRQRWSSQEEEALVAGVAKHGTRKWKVIKEDPQFGDILGSRSNIVLKDKWRYMNLKRNRDSQTSSSAAPAAHLGPVQTSASAAHLEPEVAQNGPANAAVDESPLQCDGIIYEAILTLQPNGSDSTSIKNFIEQRPDNFKRSVGSWLRRLVRQGKLEKETSCYRIVEGNWEPEMALLERAAKAAAQKIAVAEHKECVASEAVKEADRVSAMGEEAEIMLLVAEKIFEECKLLELLCESQHPVISYML